MTVITQETIEINRYVYPRIVQEPQDQLTSSLQIVYDKEFGKLVRADFKLFYCLIYLVNLLQSLMKTQRTTCV